MMGPPTSQAMSMQQQLMQTVRSPPPNRSPQSNPSPRAQPSASPMNQQSGNAEMHMHPHQSPIPNMPAGEYIYSKKIRKKNPTPTSTFTIN